MDRSMGKFTPSQGEFRPWFCYKPPRLSSFYSKTSATPQFQIFNDNQFGKEVKAKAHK